MPHKKAPASDPVDRETGATQKGNAPENGAADPVQTEASNGSFSESDPNRPRWDAATVLEAEYDYHHEDGSYSHTVLKGRRADGKKAFLNGRRFAGSISDLQMARQDGRKFYGFPGIKLFEIGAGE
jgi:hypothetical protein